MTWLDSHLAGCLDCGRLICSTPGRCPRLAPLIASVRDRDVAADAGHGLALPQLETGPAVRTDANRRDYCNPHGIPRTWRLP